LNPISGHSKFETYEEQSRLVMQKIAFNLASLVDRDVILVASLKTKEKESERCRPWAFEADNEPFAYGIFRISALYKA